MGLEQLYRDTSSDTGARSFSLFHRYKIRVIAAVASAAVIFLAIWASRLPSEQLFA